MATLATPLRVAVVVAIPLSLRKLPIKKNLHVSFQKTLFFAKTRYQILSDFTFCKDMLWTKPLDQQPSPCPEQVHVLLISHAVKTTRAITINFKDLRRSR